MSRFALLATTLLGLVQASFGAPAADAAQDPCAKIAGKHFAPPADALACLKSFPFDEALRQNVLTVVSRVFDFYTFEDYYLNSPAPFQESTVDIRAELSRINSTTYEVCCWYATVRVAMLTRSRLTTTLTVTCSNSQLG